MWASPNSGSWRSSARAAASPGHLGVGVPSFTEFRSLLASMVGSGAVEVTDDEMYRRSDPKAKPASKKNKVKRGRGRSGRKAAE